MNIQVSSIHFSVDPKLTSFITKKVSKLDTYFDGIIGAEVILKVTKPETANNKVVEVKLSIPLSGYLFAEKKADSFEEACDLAVDAIRRQLNKYKEKLREK